MTFCNSGTEATLYECRLARATTGRPLIAKFEGGYHGTHDLLAVSIGRPSQALDLFGPVDDPTAIPDSPGLAEGAWRDTIVLPFNHPAAFDKIRRHADRLAGVIIDPVQGAAGAIPADREFLLELRRVTQEIGAFLVFDEVITGLRLAGYSFDEMGFELLDERNETRILGPFGVPPILIGSRVGLARSTYSNYEQARDAYWQDTAIHEVRLFEDDYRYYLGNGNDWVAFDFSDVPAFQNDLPPIVDAWVKLVNLGVPKAQAAEVVGLPLGELEDGDVAYMPLGLVPLQEAAEARQANRDALAEARDARNEPNNDRPGSWP